MSQQSSVYFAYIALLLVAYIFLTLTTFIGSPASRRRELSWLFAWSVWAGLFAALFIHMFLHG